MSIRRSFRRQECDDCGDYIQEGDPVYFLGPERVCERCAEEAEIVCPSCGGSKKPEFDTCYECRQGKTGSLEIVVGDE